MVCFLEHKCRTPRVLIYKFEPIYVRMHAFTSHNSEEKDAQVLKVVPNKTTSLERRCTGDILVGWRKLRDRLRGFQERRRKDGRIF